MFSLPSPLSYLNWLPTNKCKSVIRRTQCHSLCQLCRKGRLYGVIVRWKCTKRLASCLLKVFFLVGGRGGGGSSPLCPFPYYGPEIYTAKQAILEKIYWQFKLARVSVKNEQWFLQWVLLNWRPVTVLARTTAYLIDDLPGPISIFLMFFLRFHSDYRYGTWPMFS